MSGRLLKVTEHSLLVRVAWIVPELEEGEAERIHRDHRCRVTDPAEPRRLKRPPRSCSLWDCDHGQVGAVVSFGIGPPGVSRNIDLAFLIDIQTHAHR